MMKHYKLVGRRVIECTMHESNYEIENRQVACTLIGPLRVSTVFLPIDHRIHGEGPPLVFETMVFMDSAGDNTDAQFHQDVGRMERYSSYQGALDGHNTMVDELREVVALVNGAIESIELRSAATDALDQFDPNYKPVSLAKPGDKQKQD